MAGGGEGGDSGSDGGNSGRGKHSGWEGGCHKAFHEEVLRVDIGGGRVTIEKIGWKNMKGYLF